MAPSHDEQNPEGTLPEERLREHLKQLADRLARADEHVAQVLTDVDAIVHEPALSPAGKREAMAYADAWRRARKTLSMLRDFATDEEPAASPEEAPAHWHQAD